MSVFRNTGRLSLLALTAAVSACNSTTTPSPEATAENFARAMHSGDPNAVKMFINERNPALFLLGSQVYTRMAEAGKKASAQHGEIKTIDTDLVAQHGSNAVVRTKLVYTDGFTDSGDVPLEQVEGQWYVAPAQHN